MDKIKIAFFDTKSYDRNAFDAAASKSELEIKYFKNKLNPDTAVQTAGYDVVCCFVNDLLNKKVIEDLQKNNIKLIALRCAGYNNVDLKAIFGKIHVVRVPAYSPHAVAEHSISMMMTLNRKLHKAHYRTHDHNFNIEGLLGFDMYGKTAGVIGTGKIGKIVVEILRGFGMKVLVYNPFIEEDFAKKTGCEYVELDRLYSESHIISLHCPLTKETYHMIDNSSINKMREGVMLINTGRGQLINTKDLIEGLKTHRIGYAGLDVYEEEGDYFFEDFSNQIIEDDILARLLTFPNVLITSHQAFFTREAINNIAETTVNNITEFFNEGKLTNEICYNCELKTCPRKETGKCF